MIGTHSSVLGPFAHKLADVDPSVRRLLPNDKPLVNAGLGMAYRQRPVCMALMVVPPVCTALMVVASAPAVPMVAPAPVEPIARLPFPRKSVDSIFNAPYPAVPAWELSARSVKA